MTSKKIKFRDTLFDPFDDQNFNAYFEELYIPLCQYSLKFVNDSCVAEDIVQDNFVYLWENRERLYKIDSVKAYLFSAVKNKSLNHLKTKYIKNTLHKIDNLQNTIIDNIHPSALELLECGELEAILEKALNHLPERCRIIFTMKRFGGKTNKEIAEDLNISVKTVEAQMTIAFKKLSLFVNTHWETPVIVLLNVFLNLSEKNNMNVRLNT